jgi:hypothetical protein
VTQRHVLGCTLGINERWSAPLLHSGYTRPAVSRLPILNRILAGPKKSFESELGLGRCSFLGFG